MEKKYEILTQKEYSKTYFADTDNPITVHRIRALRDFGDVKKGWLGGYITSEENLSHEGDCWVYDDATIIGTFPRIMHVAEIRDNAVIYGNVKVFGNAIIKDSSFITDYAVIGDSAVIGGKTAIIGTVSITGKARVYNAHIAGRTKITGNAKIGKRRRKFVSIANASITDDCFIEEGAIVVGNIYLSGDTSIGSDTCIFCPPLPGYKLTLENTKVDFGSFILGKGTISDSQFEKNFRLSTTAAEISISNAHVFEDISLSNSGDIAKSEEDNHYDIRPVNKQKKIIFKY